VVKFLIITYYESLLSMPLKGMWKSVVV